MKADEAVIGEKDQRFKKRNVWRVLIKAEKRKTQVSGGEKRTHGKDREWEGRENAERKVLIQPSQIFEGNGKQWKLIDQAPGSWKEK